MASESSVSDRSTYEFPTEKKVGDDTKEEEKHEQKEAPFDDETEEESERVREINKSIQEPQVSNSSEPVVGTNEGKSNDDADFTSKEPVNSEFKHEDFRDAEVVSTSENESKSEKAPLISSVKAETLEAADPASLKNEVNVELVKTEDAEDEVQELVHTDEVPTILVLNTSERPEDNDVYMGSLDSIKIPVKDLEAQSSLSQEPKPEGNAETKVDIELIKSDKEKDEAEELAPVEIPFDASKAHEKDDSILITPTNIEGPPNVPDVDICSPEEKKQEEVAEEKNDVDSIAPSTEVPVKDLVDFNSSEEKKQEGAEEKNVYSITLSSIEVPVKDPNVDLSSPEEKEQAEAAEIKEHIEWIMSEDSKKEVQDLIPAKVANDASEDPENDNVGSSALTSIEVPVKDLEVNPGHPEEQKSEESAETKIDTKSKDEDQDLVPAKILTDTSEIQERKDVESSTPTSIEVSVKDLEVESGSPEEQKQERETEIKNPDSNTTTVDSGTEVIGSSSYEEKFSGVAQMVVKKDEGFKEELLQTTTEFPEELKPRSEADQTQSDAAELVEEKDDGIKKDVIQTTTELSKDNKVRSEVDQTQSNEEKVSQGLAVIEDEVDEDSVERSTVLGVVPPVAKASSEYENVFEPGEVVQERKDETSDGDNIISIPKVSEVSLEGSVLEEDNPIVKDVTAEAMERGLSETSKDIIVAEVSTDQVKAPENVEESLKVTSKDLIFSFETSEVSSAGQRIIASDEKSESLNGEHSTLVESPQGISVSGESLHKLIEEKKNKISKSVVDALAELAPETVKDILASEEYKEKKDETSKDLRLEEKNVNIPENREEEKVEETIEKITDKPEHKELAEKEEIEKSKEQDPIVSSGDSMIKEVNKRDSNIFSKFKRSVIKARKAILGKSPGPKTQAKSENI